MGKEVYLMGDNMDEQIVDETALQIYKDKQVSLSNALIQAKEKTSLLESKIELLAIYRMKDEMNVVVKKDANGKSYDVHKVSISARELKELSGRTGNSLYRDMETIAIALKSKLYIYRDPMKEQFAMKNIYGDINYGQGVLDIEFNPDTENLFLDLTDNFTKLRLDIAFRFQTNGGFQLYKLLKSYAYVLPKVDFEKTQEQQAVIEKQYTLSELRLQLGYVDLNQEEIKKEGAKAHPNSDKMVELERRPKYKRWADFSNRVIEPGIKEINDMSDIYISSMKKIAGAHGKVEGVIFVVQNNLSWYKKAYDDGKYDDDKEDKENAHTIPVTEEEIDTFIDEMMGLIKEKLSISMLKEIAKAATYDMEKIKTAYEVMENYNKPIDNVAQFLIKAIVENWELPVKREGKKKKPHNQFNDFPQRAYDYDELAKAFFANK